jgi:hypothetical protein
MSTGSRPNRRLPICSTIVPLSILIAVYIVPLLLYQRTDKWGSEYGAALSVAKTSQSTARIDRTVHNVALSRTFVRSVLP